MKKLCLLFALLFLPVVLGASFTVSVQPSVINATQTTTLKFILDNLDATQNITEVNITLPSGFSYEGNLNPAEKCNWVAPRLIKCDGTPFIANRSETNVSFSVNASVTSTGNYTFTFDAIDTNGLLTHNTTNVTVNDTTPPIISSLFPANNTPPVKYSPGASYIFNATFSDNIAIDSIEFFWNGTLNYTVNNTNKSSLSVSVVKEDLPVGIYTWSWCVNDTSGNSNCTGDYILNVTKAENPITVYLNGKQNQNITVCLNLSQNVTVNITVLAKGNITAYLENKILGSSLDSYNSYYTFNDTGTYELFANATGNANYTANTTGVSYWIKVIYPPARYKGVVLPSSHTYSPDASYTFKITWYSPVAPANNITNVSFTWQGTAHYLAVTNNSYATYSYTVKDLAAGSYAWKWCAKDTQGEENCTSGTFTVNKATPSLALAGIKAYVAPANITIVGLGCPTQGASDVSCKLYVNNTPISGTTYSFTANEPGTWVFVFNTSGGANYTSASVSGIVTVTKPTNQTTTTTTVNQTTTTLPNQTTTTTPSTPVILNETKNFTQITTTSPAVFQIKQPEIFKIEKIEIAVKQKVTNVKVTVAPASEVKVSPPVPANKGSVFTYVQITSTVPESSVKQIKINFEVTKSWIETNKINVNSIALYRWAGSWQKLETKKISEDRNYVHYQAISPGFSLYAIAGEKSKGINWTLVWIVVIIVVASILAYLFWPTETGKQYEYLKKKWSRPFPSKLAL